MIVGLAGDWHGDLAWARSRIEMLTEYEVTVLFHVGDYSVWPGPSGQRYLTEIENVAARCGVTIYLTPGNHEWWPRLLSLKLEQRDDVGKLGWLTDNQAVLPRDPAGHRFTLDGRTFLSLGGAPSVDVEYRQLGRDWWIEEAIPEATAQQAAADGHAEIMLTHDAPGPPYMTPATQQILDDNPLGWSDRALAYATQGRDRLTGVVEAVQPLLLVHGHYHVADQATVQLPGAGHGTHVVSLPNEHQHGNIALLDLDDLHVHIPARPSGFREETP